MTGVVDAEFWHFAADPYSDRGCDWEEWASDAFRLEGWAPAALRRVTDNMQFSRWGIMGVIGWMIDVIILSGGEH